MNRYHGPLGVVALCDPRKKNMICSTCWPCLAIQSQSKHWAIFVLRLFSTDSDTKITIFMPIVTTVTSPVLVKTTGWTLCILAKYSSRNYDQYSSRIPILKKIQRYYLLTPSTKHMGVDAHSWVC